MTEDEMAGWHHRLDGHEFGCDGIINGIVFLISLSDGLLLVYSINFGLMG